MCQRGPTLAEYCWRSDKLYDYGCHVPGKGTEPQSPAPSGNQSHLSVVDTQGAVAVQFDLIRPLGAIR